MFTPLIIALFVFAIILSGAFAGAIARRYVPQHHPPSIGGDEKRGLHIHGSGCYDFCLGSWALAFKREQFVQRGPGTSDLDLGRNPPAGSASSSIRLRNETGSGKAARICRKKKG